MHRTYRTMYRLGMTPWDSEQVPEPLVTIAEADPRQPPGTAVDLGCGTGRQARYLAARGWSVVAVDYVPAAIAAARRAGDLDVDFRVADVTRPDEVDPEGDLAGSASLILDNGCLHGIPAGLRRGWARTVRHLASPGADLLVRAAGRRSGSGWGPSGIDPDELGALLDPTWIVQSAPAAGWHHYRAPATVRPD